MNWLHDASYAAHKTALALILLAMTRRDFSDRHIGPSSEQVATMLHELGYNSLENFVAAVLPESITIKERFGTKLPAPITEVDVITELRALAQENVQAESLIAFLLCSSMFKPNGLFAPMFNGSILSLVPAL